MEVKNCQPLSGQSLVPQLTSRMAAEAIGTQPRGVARVIHDAVATARLRTRFALQARGARMAGDARLSLLPGTVVALEDARVAAKTGGAHMANATGLSEHPRAVEAPLHLQTSHGQVVVRRCCRHRGR